MARISSRKMKKYVREAVKEEFKAMNRERHPTGGVGWHHIDANTIMIEDEVKKVKQEPVDHEDSSREQFHQTMTDNDPKSTDSDQTMTNGNHESTNEQSDSAAPDGQAQPVQINVPARPIIENKKKVGTIRNSELAFLLKDTKNQSGKRASRFKGSYGLHKKQ